MKFEIKTDKKTGKPEQQCIRSGPYSICSNGNKKDAVYVCYYYKEPIGSNITSQYEAKKVCFEHSKRFTDI